MIPISLNPRTSQNINYKLTEAYLSKVLTIDDIAMLAEDVPTPTENNNKVIITNDYGVLDYSFIEPYTTSISSEDEGDLIITDSTGKLDNSFLHSTNSKLANSVVITDNDGYINYNLLKASVTPTANYIPIANNSNKLDNNWLNNVVSSTGTSDKSKVVITNSNGKINNNLLNATTTSNSNSLPLSNDDGKINDNWLTTTVTSSPDTILKLNSTGKIDSSVIPSGLFLPLAGGNMTGSIVITGKGNNNSRTLSNLSSSLPNFIGLSANSYTDGFIIGMNGTGASDENYLLIATYDNGNEPIYVRQYAGASGFVNMVDDNIAHQITLMDKDGYTGLNKLTVNSDIISTNGALSVKNGITSTNGNLSIAGTSTLTGNVTAKGTLSVTGTSTLTGKLTANGGIEVNGTSTLKGNTFVTGTISSSGKATLNSLEVTNASTLKGTLSVTGTSTLTGLLTANGRVIITGSGDKINESGDTSAPLIIGNASGYHLSLDEDEISSRTNSSGGTRGLYLQPDGGIVSIGEHRTQNDAHLYVHGNVYVKNKLILSTQSPTVGSTNTAEPIRVYNPDPNNNGITTLIGGNGCTIVGGGEAALELYRYYNETNNAYNTSTYNENNKPTTNAYWISDNLVLTADGTVYIHSNVQDNYNNKKEWIFGSNGVLTAPGNITSSGKISSSSISVTGNISSGSLDTGPVSASTITATGNITATGKTVTAGNFDGKWAGYTQDIGTKPSIADTTWILLNNSAKIQHTTIGDIKSHISSSINNKLPVPTSTSGAIGQMFTGYGRYHTLPSGGTWFWWANCFNANSTSIGPKWGISSGGSEIDLQYDNVRAHIFAMRINNT